MPLPALPDRPCEFCGTFFHPAKRSWRFHSKKCAAMARAGAVSALKKKHDQPFWVRNADAIAAAKREQYAEDPEFRRRVLARVRQGASTIGIVVGAHYLFVSLAYLGVSAHDMRQAVKLMEAARPMNSAFGGGYYDILGGQSQSKPSDAPDESGRPF